MSKSSKSALAEHLGLDLADMKNYTYQPGRFSIAVYAIDEYYYCATKGSARPAKRTRDNHHFKWAEVPDAYLNANGFRIWKANETVNT